METVHTIVVAALIALGGALVLLGAAGIVRMPDLYTRMHAATKPVILGSGCLLAAAAVHFGQLGVTTRAALAVAILLLTGPVAAHVIGRAAYFSGAALWEGTVRDDLCGQYDLRTHELGNVLAPAPDGRAAVAERPRASIPTD